MSAPAYLAATAGYRSLPGQVNQFLAAHGATWVYAGAQRAAQTTGTGVYASTAGQYLAQQFTTAAGQSAIGQVWLQLSTVGGSPLTATIPPLTVALYASSAGAPTGSALASATLAEQYVYSAPFWLPVPLAATGLTASTVYQLVASPAGSGAAYYAWQHSNQASGASTSTNATTWSAQTYGLLFQVFDQSPGGQVQFITEDGGARIVQFTYNTQALPSQIVEQTIAQDGSVLYSTRALTYTGGALSGVA